VINASVIIIRGEIAGELTFGLCLRAAKWANANAYKKSTADVGSPARARTDRTMPVMVPIVNILLT